MGIPEMTRFGRAICGDLHEPERRELASFTSASAAGRLNAR
jgi:hypothetical protein